VAGPVVLKKLLTDRHWQVYRTFCAQYDKAARTVDRELVGTYPSRAQLHRWLAGELKTRPHPHHCQVLEAMLPGVRAIEMFEPIAPVEHLSERPPASDRPDLIALVTAGLSMPATRSAGWHAERLVVPGISGPLPGTGSSAIRTAGTPAERLARDVLILGRRLRLTDAETAELAALAGHLVDLELDCTIDIDGDGWGDVTYRFLLVNLTDQPVRRMIPEQWFENTHGRLRIEPHPSSDREVSIQRLHDAAGMSKFACMFSPAIGPGQVGTIAYTTHGGRFLHDHYWRQSASRYTRRMTLSITHCGVDMLVNCTAIVDRNDGSQSSAIENLVCACGDGAALITLTQDYLQPNDAVTIRWEAAHGVA
jgi:hypothetical protein